MSASIDECETSGSAEKGETLDDDEVSSGPWLKTLGTGLGGRA